ncbi:hypothetical protein BZG36_02947 [Bifiguratus adelaidae]|uniref:Uncharacterized protein n=1 Tax=Bifiguratus adelaidae TaxID=1938954 RepID=A0A261Y0C0_9FUNG|nr:hypothetical protein BZG36_02947 [Bifiguratus adelaidae]
MPLTADNKKTVQFDTTQNLVIWTFGDDEYDRTASDPSKLTYTDMLELLQLRCDFRRQMEEMMAAAGAESESECESNAGLSSPPHSYSLSSSSSAESTPVMSPHAEDVETSMESQPNETPWTESPSFPHGLAV